VALLRRESTTAARRQMVSLRRRVPHHARNRSNAYAPAITAQMTMATTKPQRSTGLIYSL
jgi:hypothetical protein